MFDHNILTRKYWRRAFRRKRDAIATRLFDTRLGRDILISALGPRVKELRALDEFTPHMRDIDTRK